MTDPTPQISGLPAPTPEDVIQSRRIREWAGDEFSTIRSTAESWRNAGFISAGIAVAGSLIAGPSAITELDAPWKTAVLIVLGLMFVCALGSGTLAVLASIGWPGWVKPTSPSALKDWEKSAANSAVRQVQWSMVLAGLAAVLSAIAIAGVLIVTPQSPQFSRIPGDAGSSYCADLSESPAEVSHGVLTVLVPAGEYSVIHDDRDCG